MDEVHSECECRCKIDEKRERLMTPSTYYYGSQLVWIVPPGRLFTPFEKLFKPFEFVLWISVLLTFCFFGIFIELMRKSFGKHWKFALGSHFKITFLDLFNIFFGGSIFKVPLKNFARILFMVYIFYALVIRSAYQGALFKFMKSESSGPQAQTMTDMIERNYKFYVTKSGVSYTSNIQEVKGRLVAYF